MKQINPSKVTKGNRERPLTDREEAFCRALVLGKSKIDSYKEAGYRSENKRTLYRSAVRLSQKDKILARLGELRKEIAERYQLNEDNIFKQCAAILNADARNYTRWGPIGVSIKPSAELTEAQAMAVEEVSETLTQAGGTVRVKLHSKVKALEIGARILGLFIERKEVSGRNGGPIRIVDLSDEELLSVARRALPGAPAQKKNK